MIIHELRTERFRNLNDTTLNFADQGQIIIGDNGQGKTNLLEALYYLTILKSFHSRNDSECIRFGERYFNLKARWSDDGGLVEDISVGYDGRRRKVVLSGSETVRATKAFGCFKSVILTPDDIAIVKGGPKVRRKYLDIVLSILNPLYLERFKRYKRALAARNVLLKEEFLSEEIISPWEEQMAESGSFLAVERNEFIKDLAPLFEEIYRKLSSGEKGELRYRSALMEDGACSPAGGETERTDGIREVFRHRLKAMRERERLRGITLTGPQTDDLDFGIEGRPLRDYGSQGQQRTAVISLKLAEARIMEKLKGVRPVLLLDDIFAELDTGRSNNLLEELVETHQSFVTAPAREKIFGYLGLLPVMNIRGGVVTGDIRAV